MDLEIPEKLFAYLAKFQSPEDSWRQTLPDKTV